MNLTYSTNSWFGVNTVSLLMSLKPCYFIKMFMEPKWKWIVTTYFWDLSLSNNIDSFYISVNFIWFFLVLSPKSAKSICWGIIIHRWHFYRPIKLFSSSVEIKTIQFIYLFPLSNQGIIYIASSRWETLFSKLGRNNYKVTFSNCLSQKCVSCKKNRWILYGIHTGGSSHLSQLKTVWTRITALVLKDSELEAAVLAM